MNRIQMYASSAQLRLGLHRVLAVAYAIGADLVPDRRAAWWEALPETHQDAARAHRLGLEALAEAFVCLDRVVDEARRRLGLEPLDGAAVQAAFRDAIISGRAHRAHGGRDVYGASNKRLFDLVCGDFGRRVAERYGASLGEDFVAPGGAPSEAALSLAETLMRFDTTPEGEGHAACVDWLVRQLNAMGFEVELLAPASGRPLIRAHRGARGFAGHVVMYGHYDTMPYGKREKWAAPPERLTVEGGRLHGRGIADNKGPLACRLAAVGARDTSPELTWLIQGEEETGSPVAHRELPRVMANLSPTLWLDETGYHDHEDGTLRVLARQMGEEDASLPPDPELEALAAGLSALASRWGVGARPEIRGLNKNVVAGGCPFNRSLPAGARYLAAGVNDSRARIHGVGESLPAWTFPHHEAQLDVIFAWTHQVEGGET